VEVAAAGGRPDGAGRRIDFPRARPRLLTIAFTLLWLCGWLFLLALTALDYRRFGSLHLSAIVLLGLAWPPVGLALLWAASGKRESLIVSPLELRIIRWAGPFKLQSSISASAVIGLRTVVVPRTFFPDFNAVSKFYSGGRGVIAIDTTGRTFSVGHTLTAGAAGLIIEEISRFLPQLGTRSREAVIPRRRAIDYAAGFMTLAMIRFAVELPARLAIIDRPICFYDENIVPRHPIDVSGMHPGGRVVLVPIDDFPADRAAAIAERFRTTLGIAIEVAPAVPWPAGAYDESRRQMNSAAMLTRLESTYATAGASVVAIGLTTRDMFNPEVSWAYVFSYRGNRVAVVSPARMDRGCMGLVQASDDRIMARLRKMVGKNIGILYFGLDMSTDPASMLYSQIGGPQELDAMSERF
jgi:predicted Zn-dependent protease